MLFLFSFSAIGRDNDPPIVTCVEVHEAGNVTIRWQPLAPEIQELHIFFKVGSLDWDTAGSVYNNLALDFAHTTARADTAKYSYYIKAIFRDGSNDSTIVFNPIYLEVFEITLGEASLYWNEVSNPLPDSSSTYYYIFKSIFENGIPPNWVFIDSTENTSHIYIIEDGLCNDSINFKIEIENSFRCSSISNIAGNWFTENIQPLKPVLDSVSVINNNEVILGWTPSVSIDVIGTIIYRWEKDNGINKWIIIDTVFTDSSYIDRDYIPCDTNYQYAIAALPNCGLPSPKTEETAQRPILLYEPEYDLCSETISLNWEEYIHATDPFDKYEIWSSKSGNPFIYIDEVSPTQLFYNHESVDNNTDYIYFIKAVFGDLEFTSTSCTKSIKTGNFIKPQWIYLANADVLHTDNNNIELTLDVDLAPDSCTWEILRSEAGGYVKTPLTTITRSEITTPTYTYLDATADGSTGFYFYSVNVYDSCGDPAFQSNTIKTIFLEYEQFPEDKIRLKWNAFEGWDGDIERYDVFRIIGDQATEILIGSTFGITEYTDNLTSDEASENKFSYWVQASEKEINTYDYKEKSNSNIIRFFKETNFYFPNAFRPNGNNIENNTFKPVTVGFGGSNYLLQIYNRWGQLIFESKDYTKGWDGRYKGEVSQQGTYVYKLIYTDVQDIKKEQQGSFTLID